MLDTTYRKGMDAIQTNVPLAPLTTIQLGGSAAYFVSVKTVVELQQALAYVKEKKLPVHTLSGGSNTIFSDDGFSGLVIKIALQGVEFVPDGDTVLVSAAAGENWDDLVLQCIERDLAGMETLSGIPGSVGATPIQNVGAYGQEVSQIIQTVDVIDRATLEQKMFTSSECDFAYRSSRFKRDDVNRFVITRVTYRLQPGGAPVLTYPQVIDALEKIGGIGNLKKGKEQLMKVRDVVLGLRRSKSMVVDSNDIYSRSCGSFFVNPIASGKDLEIITERWKVNGGEGEVPTFTDSVGGARRVPAAWLIQESGFQKGEQRDGVGISANHYLALVNYGGTTKALLAFAEHVQEKVFETFGVRLVREPVVVEE